LGGVFGDSRTISLDLVELLNRWKSVRFDIGIGPLSYVGGPRFRPASPDETWGTRHPEKENARTGWVRARRCSVHKITWGIIFVKWDLVILWAWAV
jgi:hypothetical protein